MQTSEIMKSYEENKQIESAIRFLIESFDKSSSNSKPVVLHSVRVGMFLYDCEYKNDIVIAGILHDVLEDTSVTAEEITKEFGDEVARLVEANTFDKNITDRTKAYKENFSRCIAAGKDALIIKAADFLDNFEYCKFDEMWLKKMEYFLEIAKDALCDEIVYKELKSRV